MTAGRQAADAALLLVSALLFGISFPNFIVTEGVPFCAWGCALPLFYVLEGKPPGQRLAVGWVWGFLAHAFLVSALFSVSPGGWVLLAGALAMQGVVFALFYPSSMLPSWCRLLLIPSAWAASEWVRAGALGGFSWGVGYSQAGVIPVIQPAAWGGAYAVTWIVMVFNAVLYFSIRAFMSLYLKREMFYWLAAWLTGVVVLVAAGAGCAAKDHVASGHMRVAAIQPDIAWMEKGREDLYDVHAARHLTLTRQAVALERMGPADMVVWPETSFPDDILDDPLWRRRLERTAKELGVNFLVGSALLRDGKDFNSALFLSSEGRWLEIYDKEHLVPFCEFTPAGWAAVAQGMKIGRHHFYAGGRPGLMRLPGGKNFGVAICSEEFYPASFRSMACRGAGFAVVMLNDGWFARPDALLMHALAAPLRAVESGLSVVRTANTGKTCAFDRRGRSLGRALEVQRPGAAVFDLPLAGKITFYAKWGDIFVMMCALFVIIFFMLTQVVYHRRRVENAAV
ncbi:MAG: apolipoprotein N-acyltransferase [Candidatus Omnitrophota bacterium]